MASTPEMTRSIAEKWFGALKAGKGEEALSCLDQNIVWINNPPEKGLSDIIPWLGEYHGFQAVLGTFVIWGQLSQVRNFELRELVINGDEVFAVVHEVAEIKATGLCYDIEFIQRFRVSDGKIVFWKSYWDTVKGIIPFRGDMRSRLIASASKGDLDEAMKVLPFGADPNCRDEVSGQSALMIAGGRGHLNVVEALLRHGVNPNAIDPRAGTSPLHKACQGGHLEVVKALVEAGAFIDLQATTTGHTPLMEAIWFASDAIVEYLLERNARLELKTYYGFTLDQHLQYALNVNKGANRPALPKIQEMIAQRRANDEPKKSSPLNAAVLNNDLEGVRKAIAAGANLEERYPIVCSFSDGHTPLLIACRDGREEIVAELIKAGADVNAVEPVFGAVPLHKATYHGYVKITQMLAKAAGVNLNYQGPSNGYTPLHDSLWHGYADCAQVLLSAGARTDIVAYDGKLPIDIAIEQFGPKHEIVLELERIAKAKITPSQL